MVYGTIDGLSYPFLAEDINAIMFFLKKRNICRRNCAYRNHSWTITHHMLLRYVLP